MEMSSSQLEKAYRKEAELIAYKIALGEYSQAEGDFMLDKAQARLTREMARLKRPARVYPLIFILILLSVFIYSFFEQLQYNNASGFSSVFLIGMGFSMIGFMLLFHREFRGLESSFGRYFSKYYLRKILYEPKIAFEWKQTDMIQVRLQIKNSAHVFAGLLEEENFELRSHVLTMVSDVFDDDYGIIEQIDADIFVIDYYVSNKGPQLLDVMKKVEQIFANLKSRDGEFFAKSIRMGASVVKGSFRSGNIGFGLQVFRTAGRKTLVAKALVDAAGWEEIYIDEETFSELDKDVYARECEPIFLRLNKELVKVFLVTGWKEK